MAISFARMVIHTRSKGHSAVAASAYRAGVTLYDERTGETHDYSHRTDVAHSEILLPENTVIAFSDRERLWNMAEAAERRKDAQLAKELTIALPRELSLEHQIRLARSFTHEHFISHGLAAELAIHDKGDENPHAHILITMRRIEGNRFSAKKARDLNPIFYGKSQKKLFDYWHHKWRDHQEAYFKEHGIELTVDADYLVPTRHEGRVRSSENHYLKDDNSLRQQASIEQVMSSSDVTLDYLSSRYATFTEKDIASFLFKNTGSTEDYQMMLTQVMGSKHLLALGPGEDGRERFTTRLSYEREQQMISEALSLSGRRDKAISVSVINHAAESYGLFEEQKEALQYLLQQGDIACLVGRAGAGKTYTMKAVQSVYTQAGFKIYGAALAGVAAKKLEAETGIKSDTIFSLTKRIEKGQFQPHPGSILVIDEAGMVSLKDMAMITQFAKQAHCKMILLGDPDQLQPIMAGASFRAICDHVGFVEMQDIKRQKDPLDREASQQLAQGKIGLALDHYQTNGQLILDSEAIIQERLISDWQKSLDGNIDKQIILAHTRAQTAILNRQARQILLDHKLIDSKEHTVSAITGQVRLSQGDHIVFLKNNYDLNVFNGDFATVKSIEGSKITATLQDRDVTFDSKAYHDFDYGYAVTIHKSQGTTFDRVFTYVDGWGWDRYLTYVALTRHKDNLMIYANKDEYRDLSTLKRRLSRAPIRDNAIDYPLSFAERRGFDPDSTIGRAINHLEGIHNKIKDRWLYMTNYEAWVLTRERQERIKHSKAIRSEARIVAEFSDLNKTVGCGWSDIYREYGKDKVLQSPDYTALLDQTNKRNALAHQIYMNYGTHVKALEANRISLDQLKAYSDKHNLRQPIKINLISDELKNEIESLRKVDNKQIQWLIKFHDILQSKKPGDGTKNITRSIDQLIEKISQRPRTHNLIKSHAPKLANQIKAFTKLRNKDRDIEKEWFDD